MTNPIVRESELSTKRAASPTSRLAQEVHRVRNAGIKLEDVLNVFEKGYAPRGYLALVWLLDHSSSQASRVGGPDSPRRIDLMNDAVFKSIDVLGKDDEVNNQILVLILAFNHEVEAVDGCIWRHPRDLEYTPLEPSGFTRVENALITGMAAGYELTHEGRHFVGDPLVPITCVISDFEDSVSRETSDLMCEYQEDLRALVYGFSTTPINFNDPGFVAPDPWCLKEAVPDPLHRFAVQNEEDLMKGYAQFANVTSMLAMRWTQTAPGEKPHFTDEEDPFRRDDNKLIVPKLDDLL